MARPVETVSGGQRGGEGIIARGGTSLALAALCTLLFLTFLDNTVVSVALGQVYTNLGASPTQLQWVVGAYALTFASLMLACGMIGTTRGSSAACSGLASLKGHRGSPPPSFSHHLTAFYNFKTLSCDTNSLVMPQVPQNQFGFSRGAFR